MKQLSAKIGTVLAVLMLAVFCIVTLSIPVWGAIFTVIVGLAVLPEVGWDGIEALLPIFLAVVLQTCWSVWFFHYVVGGCK